MNYLPARESSGFGVMKVCSGTNSYEKNCANLLATGGVSEPNSARKISMLVTICLQITNYQVAYITLLIFLQSKCIAFGMKIKAQTY